MGPESPSRRAISAASFRADLFIELDGGNISRSFNGSAECDPTFVLLVIVVWLVELFHGVGIFVTNRFIEEQRSRRESRVDGRGIGKGFESRAGLAFCLCGSVELAPLEVETADHGLDLPRADIESQKGALDLRYLARG